MRTIPYDSRRPLRVRFDFTRMRAYFFVLMLAALPLAAEERELRDAPRWCTGVCETYWLQIEIAYRDAAPDADRPAMAKARRRAIETMRRGDWSQAGHDAFAVRCHAKIGAPEYRGFWCPAEANETIIDGPVRRR